MKMGFSGYRPVCANDGSWIYERKPDLSLVYLLFSIVSTCKYSVMILRDRGNVGIMLKDTLQPVSEDLIDAKWTHLQKIEMDTSELVIQYTNRINILVNGLAATCQGLAKLYI